MKTPAALLTLLFTLPLFSAEPVDTKGLKPLFNGKDLSGWHGNNPHTTSKAKEGREESLKKQAEAFPNHWVVKDGVLWNDGHGPYATTDKEYGDIEFSVDYKTVPIADSGVYLRGTPQIQIWDHHNEKIHKLGGNLGSGGLWNNSKGAPGKDPLVLADRPFGQWNEIRVRQIGARTWVWLNDKVTVDGAIMENFWNRELPLPAKGPIHLQTHGGEISWRNMAVRELKAEEANAYLRGDDEGFTSIFNGRDLTGWSGPIYSYEVVDGALTCKPGKGGTLYYDEMLKDFVVRLEFKLPPGGNNGLAIRYPGKGDTAYQGLCELQVLDNTAEKYAKLDDRQFHGSAYGMGAAHKGYLRPVGEWNYQEVTVKGMQVKVELNGTVILDTDLSQLDPKEFMGKREHPGLKNKEGYFGFAGHSDPVQYRNVSIKKL